MFFLAHSFCFRRSSGRVTCLAAEALGRRRDDALGGFSSVFSSVASSREFGSDLDLARFHLRQAVEYGGDELAEQIADAEALFWGHVRDAVALVSGDD
jgi:hypothetical protein